MRHKKLDVRLGRSAEHRIALMASLVCGLIEQKQIRTSLVKAKQARRFAEKMITLGRRGTLSAKRQAISKLRRPGSVAKLFSDIVPQFEGRKGGYTRILKLGPRRSDGAEMALLEWVGIAAPQRKKKKEPEKEKDKETTTPEEEKKSE
jgi:large subunit ribosomal protein L17